MNEERSKGSISSSSSGTSSSSGHSGTSGTKTTSSGKSRTTSTLDRSHINDSKADVNVEIVETSDNQYIRKQNRKFDTIMVIAIIFQILLWGGIISTITYMAINFLSLSAFSPIITSILNSIKEPPQGLPNPLILGIVSSILATVAVLITREIFYHVRDSLPAGSLFRGIARVSDPCLIFTLRMKDAAQSGDFITPIPNYQAVDAKGANPNPNQFEKRQNTLWVTSTPEAQSLALILNVLGRVGRTENIEVTFPDKEYDRWDAAMFSLGGNWKTMRALETCEPHFKFQKDAFILLQTKEHFTPTSPEEDMGLLQKMINPTNGLPVWIAMGYRGAGTVSASYALVQWWKYFGALYGPKTFGLLVAFDDRDGWQQSHIVSLYPKPKWYTILRHPYAWHMLRKRMRDT